MDLNTICMLASVFFAGFSLGIAAAILSIGGH